MVATLVFLGHNIFINHAPFSPVMVVFIFVAVVPVAFVISMAYSRNQAVKRYLFSLTRLRGVWRWLLLALLVITALNVLSIVISNLLGRQSVQISDLPFRGLTLIKVVAITFFYQIFFFNLTGEEIGWRGFALPRLQTRTSPLVASLVLTFFWAMWHVFYWQAGRESIFTWQFWQETFIELFPATVIINWFYTRSKGSILVAGVTHAAANTVMQYMPGFDWPVHTVIMYAFALAVILVDRMWKKLPADHPAVYQTPALAG
jgi:membrane protease YdiL (CAAX protease family)